jgi:hypothetical protein
MEKPWTIEKDRTEKVHSIKCWPKQFDAVFSGRKRYEVRKNDRDYRVGDILNLREWDPKTGQYTGRSIAMRISYMTEGGTFGLPKDICVLGLSL